MLRKFFIRTNSEKVKVSIDHNNVLMDLKSKKLNNFFWPFVYIDSSSF